MKNILIGMVAMSCVALASEGTNLYLSTGIDISGKFEEAKITKGKDSQKLNKHDSEKSGFELTAEVTKEMVPNLELGLGLSYQDHDRPEALHVSSEKVTIKNTGYKSMPLYLVGKYNIPVESNVKPYLKANLGYSFNFGEKDLSFKGVDGKLGTSIDNGLYYGLGAGVEYNNFIVELMYKVNQADVEYKGAGIKVKDSYDYSRTTLSFGYKFNF